ncbi:DUF2866 domain-containing protein [Paraburkholderia tropica]|uniref:DUF2866 domain-containing protein n=2 Tax=Burkholderiaceae TaxID=119060 RepID=UPI000D767168
MWKANCMDNKPLKMRGFRISLETVNPFGHVCQIVEWVDPEGHIARRVAGAHLTTSAVNGLAQSFVAGVRHTLSDDEPQPKATLRKR